MPTKKHHFKHDASSADADHFWDCNKDWNLLRDPEEARLEKRFKPRDATATNADEYYHFYLEQEKPETRDNPERDKKQKYLGLGLKLMGLLGIIFIMLHINSLQNYFQFFSLWNKLFYEKTFLLFGISLIILAVIFHFILFFLKKRNIF